MTEPQTTSSVTGLGEHIQPIMVFVAFVITSLLGILGWFLKRTLGKVENNVDDLWQLCRDTIQRDLTAVDKRLTTLETEHRIRHKGDN